MTAQAADAVTGKASISKPTEGSGWTTYKLEVCEQAKPTACLPVTECNVTAADATVCNIDGCVAQTAYTLKATAYTGDGTASAVSTPAAFTTPQHA